MYSSQFPLIIFKIDKRISLEARFEKPTKHRLQFWKNEIHRRKFYRLFARSTFSIRPLQFDSKCTRAHSTSLISIFYFISELYPPWCRYQDEGRSFEYVRTQKEDCFTATNNKPDSAHLQIVVAVASGVPSVGGSLQGCRGQVVEGDRLIR